MPNYAYIRVSTDKQDLENQLHAIREKQFDVVVISETVSGKVSWHKRELGNLIEKIGEGDSLIVTELSRLGRSMLEIMELLSILTSKKVKVYSIKENFNLADDIQSKVIAFAFSLAAEIERQLISQRTKEALSYKKSIGVKLGRPSGVKDSYQRKRRK